MKKRFFLISMMVGVMLTGCNNGTTEVPVYEDVPVEAEEAIEEEAAEEETVVAESGESIEEEESVAESGNKSESGQFVDLGLPSGTKWARSDSYDFISYANAYYRFGNQLPTKEQFEELVSQCKWRWKTVVHGMSTEGSGYEVIGPNGNSIFLVANGYRDSWSDVISDVGVYGHYRSSTPYSSEYSWGISIRPNSYEVTYASREAGYSVRLVRNSN